MPRVAWQVSRQEFVIGGYKRAGTTFDSVLVGYYDARTFLYAGKVRAGFTPQTRAEVWRRISRVAGRDVPFRESPEQHRQDPLGRRHNGGGQERVAVGEVEVVMEAAFTVWSGGGNCHMPISRVALG